MQKSEGFIGNLHGNQFSQRKKSRWQYVSFPLHIHTFAFFSNDFFSHHNLLIVVTISQFSFVYPSSENRTENANGDKETKPLIIDEDGDLIVERKRSATIKIAHHDATELALVGLQVWRGALLLADFLLHNRQNFADKCIVELGSGCGLTSIAASIFSETEIICTDIDLGGILNVIKSNVELNKNLKSPRACIKVMELDFKKSMMWSAELKSALAQAKVIIAADGESRSFLLPTYVFISISFVFYLFVQ